MPAHEQREGINFVSTVWSPGLPDIREMPDTTTADRGFWAPYFDSDFEPSSSDEEFAATRSEEDALQGLATQFHGR